MNNKGFTLAELLAVIIIIAIIAVMVTPMVTGVIENAKKAAFERSVEGIVSTIETDASLKLYAVDYIYTINDGVIDNLDKNIKVGHADGFNGKIRYTKGSEVSYAIYNNKWCMTKSGEDINIIEYVDGECELPKLPYEDNGSIIYFDVTTGTKCKNYHEDNSLTGYNGTSSTKTTNNQNGCLKFYSFNYEETDIKVNLLLDHNTTAATYWSNLGQNASGPDGALTQLKTDTNSWIGTEILENYTVTQEGYGNYTIPYGDEKYKARLISANEVAKITQNMSFDENTTSHRSYFFFDTNTQTASTTCIEGNITGCQYGWLYDRTSPICKNSGCLNNAKPSTWGYWTGTSTFTNQSDAWIVLSGGSIGDDGVGVDGAYGIRPVIEVLKFKL